MIAQIRENVSDNEYYDRTDRRLTASMVKLAATGTLHEVYEYISGGGKSSPAMRASWLCHLKALEPAVWDEKIRVPPADLIEGITNADGTESRKPRQTKQYRDRLAEWEMGQSDAIVINEKELDDTREIVQSYVDSDCFTMPTRTEVAVYYEFCGMPFKSKLDGIVDHDFGVDIIDLKFLRTTKGLASTIFRYGYHIQMAIYREAMIQAGFNVGDVIIVGIDKTTRSPRDVVCSAMSESALHVGRQEAAYWTERIKQCMASGYWPGNEAPPVVDVPTWYTPSFLLDKDLTDVKGGTDDPGPTY